MLAQTSCSFRAAVPVQNRQISPSSSNIFTQPRTCARQADRLPRSSTSFLPNISVSRRQLPVVRAAGPDSDISMSPQMLEAVEKFITENKVVLFMKGNKQFPQCGFSNTCVQVLNMMEVPYETVDILESEELRQGMKDYSQWPTFPQVYIDGEFFGGCDIMIESYTNGSLKETLEAAFLA